MILYYALTTYHIQCCVLHKLTRKSDEKAVLLLSDIHKNSVAFVEQYKTSGIFDDVLLLEESVVNVHVKANEAKHKTKNMILKQACKEIKELLPVKPKSFDEIYLCPDHFPFGWYVITNKLQYHCFEEGCGVLSDNEFMLSNMSRNKTQYGLMNKLGYFGENQYAVEILADAQAQKEGYTNSKMTDFSAKRILDTLPNDKLKKVMAFFGTNEIIDLQNDSYSIILTQHMANLGIMPLSDQHLIYQLFADYFLCGDKLIIKPHPDDIAGRYGEIFGDEAVVLPFAMPSEMLGVCMKGKLNIALAANSTAVRSLSDMCNRTICFDNRILTDFRHIHRYYATAALIDYLNLNEPIGIYGNEMMFNELCISQNLCLKDFDIDNPKGNNGIAVISDKEELEYNEIQSIMNSNKVTVFLNDRKNYVWFDGQNYDVFQKVIPLYAEFEDGNHRKIYVYSEDKNILKKVGDFKMNKELKYTGVSINMDSVGQDDKEKIKMLEGVLAATEKRLCDYIANEKKLTEKIEMLEGKK